MPVIRRKLPARTPPATAPPDQRAKKIKDASKHSGFSVWQIRKFIREGALHRFWVGNKQYVDTHDLDALVEQLKGA
jgi:hypothetical protein